MKTVPNKAIEFLGQLPLFSGLNDSELITIANNMKKRTYKRGQSIYQAGQSADMLYFLTRGTIKICSESSDGQEIIKQVLQPYALFGELCLVGETHRKDDAICLNSDVIIYQISSSAFQKIMFHHQRISTKFLQWIGKRLQRTESRLEAMVFKDARARIIDFLRESASAQGKKIGYEHLIQHCLTQQDIANLTGTSRQTVTSVFNELRKANLIYFNRRSILIRDLARLA